MKDVESLKPGLSFVGGVSPRSSRCICWAVSTCYLTSHQNISAQHFLQKCKTLRSKVDKALSALPFRSSGVAAVAVAVLELEVVVAVVMAAAAALPFACYQLWLQRLLTCMHFARCCLLSLSSVAPQARCKSKEHQLPAQSIFSSTATAPKGPWLRGRPLHHIFSV